MTKLPNQFLTHWINLWVFVFCVTVLAVNGHGGEAAIILLFTMVYIFITNNDDRLKYKLNRDEIIFVTIVILFWFLNVLNTLFQPEGLEFENTTFSNLRFNWVITESVQTLTHNLRNSNHFTETGDLFTVLGKWCFTICYKSFLEFCQQL